MGGVGGRGPVEAAAEASDVTGGGPLRGWHPRMYDPPTGRATRDGWHRSCPHTSLVDFGDTIRGGMREIPTPVILLQTHALMLPKLMPRTSPRASRGAAGDGPDVRPILYRRVALVLLVAAVGGRPDPAAGQLGSALVGATGGLTAGIYTTTAIYVTEARFGRYIYSPEDVLTINPRVIPLVAGPVAGAWLGAKSGRALETAALWGGVGFLGGAALGVGTGHLVWRTSEGRWAGAVIGSALGFLAGAVLGGREGLRDDEREDVGGATFTVSIPVGGPR